MTKHLETVFMPQKPTRPWNETSGLLLQVTVVISAIFPFGVNPLIRWLEASSVLPAIAPAIIWLGLYLIMIGCAAAAMHQMQISKTIARTARTNAIPCFTCGHAIQKPELPCTECGAMYTSSNSDTRLGTIKSARRFGYAAIIIPAANIVLAVINIYYFHSGQTFMAVPSLDTELLNTIRILLGLSTFPVLIWGICVWPSLRRLKSLQL